MGKLGGGEVVSYGEVAAEAGRPRAGRAVGAILRQPSSEVPWWRVVASDGRLVCPARDEQARRLRAEGVPVVNGRVRPTGTVGAAPTACRGGATG